MYIYIKLTLWAFTKKKYELCLDMFNSSNDKIGLTDYNARHPGSILCTILERIMENCLKGYKKLPFLAVCPECYQNNTIQLVGVH